MRLSFIFVPLNLGILQNNKIQNTFHYHRKLEDKHYLHIIRNKQVVKLLIGVAQ